MSGVGTLSSYAQYRYYVQDSLFFFGVQALTHEAHLYTDNKKFSVSWIYSSQKRQKPLNMSYIQNFACKKPQSMSKFSEYELIDRILTNVQQVYRYSN